MAEAVAVALAAAVAVSAAWAVALACDCPVAVSCAGETVEPVEAVDVFECCDELFAVPPMPFCSTRKTPPATRISTRMTTPTINPVRLLRGVGGGENGGGGVGVGEAGTEGGGDAAR